MVNKITGNENDFLQFDGDKGIKKIIKEELINFTDTIIKINRRGMSQERQIMITDKAIYNLNKKTLKRRIEISFIRGITVSSLCDEFVIHCNDIEYDYHYISIRKKKLLEAIIKSYILVIKAELKCCDLVNKISKLYKEAKSLKNVVTTK